MARVYTVYCILPPGSIILIDIIEYFKILHNITGLFLLHCGYSGNLVLGWLFPSWALLQKTIYFQIEGLRYRKNLQSSYKSQKHTKYKYSLEMDYKFCAIFLCPSVYWSKIFHCKLNKQTKSHYMMWLDLTKPHTYIDTASEPSSEVNSW